MIHTLASSFSIFTCCLVRTFEEPNKFGGPSVNQHYTPPFGSQLDSRMPHFLIHSCRPSWHQYSLTIQLCLSLNQDHNEWELGWAEQSSAQTQSKLSRRVGGNSLLHDSSSWSWLVRLSNWLEIQPLNLKQITGGIDIKLLSTEGIANIVREVCTSHNDMIPICVLRIARCHLPWVGGWTTKVHACSRSRWAEEEKGTVRMVLSLLGSCLSLSWTLVPFRLRLEWHLANPASSITEPRPQQVRVGMGWAKLSSDAEQTEPLPHKPTQPRRRLRRQPNPKEALCQ